MSELTAATDGRTRRATRIREARRQLILDAATEVFSRSGYHQTRISDIVDAAGVARGTFYLYFEGKNAIFLELLDELLETLRDSVVGVDTREGAAPLMAQLFASVKAILRVMSENRALTTILIREAVGLDEEAEQKLSEFYESLRIMIAESLERGRAMGIVRELDFEVVATCILGSVRAVLEHEIVRHADRELDVDRVAMTILDYNARGLMTGVR